MIKPQFKVKTEKQTDDYGKFIVEPLEQGYGFTVGNSLRRCLLSSFQGSAVVQLKIDGIRHQFSTMEGLKEDIVQFILNVKKLRIRYTGEKEAKISLKVQGPKEVKASDLKTPPDVKIINKDLVLAHLADSKSKLNVEMEIARGYGYSLAEERKVDTLGVIPVDAAFSPVNRVNYKVESTRVGRRTDFDRIIMEIWTDGTIKPLEALKKAAKILVSYFKQVYDPVIEVIEKEEEPKENREIMSLTVEELDLPTRIVNALIKGGYKTVKDLTKADKNNVASVKNLGAKSVSIVEKRLKEKGVEFK